MAHLVGEDRSQTLLAFRRCHRLLSLHQPRRTRSSTISLFRRPRDNNSIFWRTGQRREARMTDIQHRFIEANGIRMHIAEKGSGPLILMCHGFPESWYSWRHQIEAL